MEDIADLFSLSAVTDVGEFSAQDVACGPEYDNTLVDFPHLPGSGEYAAPVNDGGDVVHVDVLVEEEFGGEFCSAVKRSGPVKWKLFGNPAWGDAVDILFFFDHKAGVGFAVFDGVEMAEGIHAAG